jgi:hypothetical protein
MPILPMSCRGAKNLLVGEPVLGGQLAGDQPGEIRHAIQVRAGVHVAVVHHGDGGLEGGLEGVDAGHFVDDHERNQMPHHVQMVQDLFREDVLAVGIEKQKPKEGAADVHRHRVAGTVPLRADRLGVLVLSLIEHAEIVDDAGPALLQNGLERGGLAQPGGVMLQGIFALSAGEVGLEPVRLLLVERHRDPLDSGKPHAELGEQHPHLLLERQVPVQLVEDVAVLEHPAVLKGNGRHAAHYSTEPRAGE